MTFLQESRIQSLHILYTFVRVSTLYELASCSSLVVTYVDVSPPQGTLPMVSVTRFPCDETSRATVPLILMSSRHDG